MEHRTIIISEETKEILDESLKMTRFKFNSRLRKFLASLLQDPIGASMDLLFSSNGLDKNTLINKLVDNKIIRKKLTIDDHDAEGNPHTAKMVVKYSVPKHRFNDRVNCLFDTLFPEIALNENCDCCSVDPSGGITPVFANPINNSTIYDKKSKPDGNNNTIGGNPYGELLQEKRQKVTKNDNGKVVPETCDCGGKVTLQIKGEPVYICKECGKYYGTMPFHSKKKMNEGAWGSNPLQSDGGLDKRDDVVADAFKYIVNHIEKNGKYESDNNYHWLGVVLWTMNRFKGSYSKSTLEKSGLDKAVKDVAKNLSKDEKFIGGWSKETQNDVRKYINNFEKQYNKLKEKYAIDGDNYERSDDKFEGKGLMATIAEKDILKEAVTGEDADKSAALYVYNKDKDENWYILCARRSNRKDDEEGGKWNPPMGHLHKGESMKDGALRECLEESGIDFSQYKKEIKIRDHHTWGSNCTLQLGDYVSPTVTIDSFEPKKGDEENSKFIWLPLEDIKSKTWAWSCGENAYKFIPGEIDLIQEIDLHRADNILNESELISPEDAIKGGFNVPDGDRTWKEGEFIEPKNTGIAYKVFYLGKDGNLYPPMIANTNGEPTPIGEWLPAASPIVVGYTEKEHRPQVQSGGKGTKGGSGLLAFRPGWHMGEVPYAAQFLKRKKIDGRYVWPSSLVWAECEYSNDVDYQDEAMSYGYTQSGKFMHSRAGLPKIPKGGSYKYRTNPNPDTVPWVIAGAMRINKLLSFEEVEQILNEHGIEPPLVMSEKEYKQRIKQINKI